MQVICETGQGPTTPWVSFKIMFGVIQDKISPVAATTWTLTSRRKMKYLRLVALFSYQ
jgi:hypothetical protein